MKAHVGTVRSPSWDKGLRNSLWLSSWGWAVWQTSRSPVCCNQWNQHWRVEWIDQHRWSQSKILLLINRSSELFLTKSILTVACYEMLQGLMNQLIIEATASKNFYGSLKLLIMLLKSSVKLQSLHLKTSLILATTKKMISWATTKITIGWIRPRSSLRRLQTIKLSWILRTMKWLLEAISFQNSWTLIIASIQEQSK